MHEALHPHQRHRHQQQRHGIGRRDLGPDWKLEELPELGCHHVETGGNADQRRSTEQRDRLKTYDDDAGKDRWPGGR
jgi:hypothetical protein